MSIPEHIKEAFYHASYKLLEKEPFLHFLAGTMVLDMKPYVKTAAVGIHGGNIKLFLSEWFASLTLDERCFVLKHEFSHIINGHLIRAKAFSKEGNITRRMNWAMDMVVNPQARSFIEGQTSELLTNAYIWPVHFGFPEGLSFNEYYALLGNRDWFDGPMLLDDHEFSDESLTEEEMESIISGKVKVANYRCIGAGSSPGDYEEIINKIVGHKCADLRNKMMGVKAACRGGKKERTWKRENRRSIQNARGVRKGPRKVVSVVLDTSGSMNGMWEPAFAEIDGIARQEDVFLIQTDCDVASAAPYKKGDWKIKGGGGTNMSPGFKLAEEKGSATIICITDGDFFGFPPQPKNAKVFWIGTKNFDVPYGELIVMNKESSWWKA